MDLKTIHLSRVCAVVISMVDAEAIQWRMDRPLAMENGLMESPVNIVSCSFVRALVSLVYNVVLAEIPNLGHTLMREFLSGVRRTEKKSDPASRSITPTS